MSTIELSYKGKHIVVNDEHPKAVVSVDGREFSCHHHHSKNGMTMWMCDEAYFASPDIRELARHFADYGYMFDDPGRIVVNDQGEVIGPNADDGSHDDHPDGPHEDHPEGTEHH
jgi:hypothetical protein